MGQVNYQLLFHSIYIRLLLWSSLISLKCLILLSLMSDIHLSYEYILLNLNQAIHIFLVYQSLFQTNVLVFEAISQ